MVADEQLELDLELASIPSRVSGNYDRVEDYLSGSHGEIGAVPLPWH